MMTIRSSVRSLFVLFVQVGLKAIYEIALLRKQEIEVYRTPLEGVCRSVAATAQSMGLEIVDDRRKPNDEASNDA